MTTKSDIPEDRQAVYLNVPDLLVTWPWLRKHNPLQNIVAEQGNVWLRSLAPLNTKSQYAFDQCDFGLFAALLFPDATEGMLNEALRPYLILQGHFQLTDICRSASHRP